MKPYLQGYGPENKSGSCKVCGINVYPPKNEPRVWPCLCTGCPYETKAKQEAIHKKLKAKAPQVAGPGGNLLLG